MVSHLLDELHLLIQEVALQEVDRGEGPACKWNPGHAHSKSLVQVLLQGLGGFHGVLSFTPLILGQLLLVLEECTAIVLLWHVQESSGSLKLLHFLLPSLRRGSPHPPEPHDMIETEAQREVGVGGP